MVHSTSPMARFTSQVRFTPLSACRSRLSFQPLTIWRAAFGVAAAYTLPDGSLSPEFFQAIGLYLVSPTGGLRVFVDCTCTHPIRHESIDDLVHCHHSLRNCETYILLADSLSFPDLEYVRQGALRSSGAVLSTLIFTAFAFLFLGINSFERALNMDSTTPIIPCP